MKTREELEEMGFTSQFAAWTTRFSVGERFTKEGDDWMTDGFRIFTPGHEPVSKEGRELLEYIATHTSLESCTEYDRAVWAYRDSLAPAPPEFEGWERNGVIYTKGNNASVWPDGNHYAWQVDHARDIHCGCRDTLPEAIKAAEEMLRMLEPVDPDGWHKTDGMAPPEEAGDRVIETVDARGNRCPRHAHSAFHCWGDESSPELRPIKWRYADGDQ